MEQKRIDQIILTYEQHVCTESLRAGVSLQDCDAEAWPALARENLPQILWDMTVHATFGSLRLADLIAGARHYMGTDGAYSACVMLVELPDIWQAKLQGGSPAHTHPDFKRWMIQAMVEVLCFCDMTGEDVVLLMQGLYQPGLGLQIETR